jgi:phosphoglycolate phosphatase-like HAD superfamily hydrolase
MKDYQAYFFDFDGTLFDSYHSLIGVYGYAFKKIGRDCTPEQAGIYMHMSLSETCDYLSIQNVDERKIFFQAVHDALDFPEYVAQITIFPDAIPTLRSLQKRGKLCGVVSGNTEKHIGLVLSQFHLNDLLSFAVGNSPYRQPKPSGDPIFEAQKHCPGIPHSAMVYIGDSLQDPETAHNGGVDGILLERRHEYPNYSGEKISTLSALLLTK